MQILKILKALSLCFGGLLLPFGVQSDIHLALGNPQEVENAAKISKTEIARTFEGRLGKVGFIKAWFSKQPYLLYEKKKPIAMLQFQEKDLKLAELFLKKKVIIKGIPQYNSKDPYLSIQVEDLCEIK